MPTWQRNLYVIWVAELVAIAGFSVAMPFLPYYVQDLGITDEAQVALWSGLLFSGQAITMGIFAPIWGSLADRFGRKLMVERAMFAGAILMAAMGFARSVQELLLLRILQGCLTGTVAAATTLVASTVPRHKAGYSLGLLQMAVYVGASAGPMLGGLVADAFGYRVAFWVTGALLFVGGWLVVFFVQEEFQPVRREGSAAGDFVRGLRLVVSSKSLQAAFAVRLLSRLGDRLLVPLLPLFIASLLTGGQVASIAGLVVGLAAASSAVGAVVLGRVSDRLGQRRVLIASTLAAAAFYVPQFFVTSVVQLALLQAATGLALGGTIASVSAAMAALAPEGRQGAVYGVDASMVSAANAIGPMAGAMLAAAVGLRPTFLCVAGVFVLASVGVARLMPENCASGVERPAE
ncbi:MAG: multidrug efflux MFS transporter [Chloroflexi bacterium]|nr:multidrug efflux MFS transporter [Chloroflexota bacterium]